MAFKIEAKFDNIEFEIPNSKRNDTVVIAVPPIDCMVPADIKKINVGLDKLNKSEDVLDVDKPKNNALILVREMLKYYNPKAATAIDGLMARELQQINTVWADESEASLGESSPSTDESSETGK
ncbi:hypothetical protein HMPREF3170_03555 [Corynebacterium sp. HMSC08D02]|uniref:hypothetical protein n=1 Tax=Corynebacterium sp. HMSC08D02 TaxID=1581138 RepID=UPI0008A30DF9|nr:hypothetical protein [Corynebacterium sp. HMSC08D02]OFT30811.1 hypothetical protein HMPREF3170_03555 [Corynebacterium sp. HMSC08D02]